MWNNTKSNLWKWIFLWIVILLYLLVFFYSQEKAIIIIKSFFKLIIQIVPVLWFVFVLMFLMNYFVNNDLLKKYMWDEAWIKGWFIAIFWWILSAWPVYAWYPLMEDLQKKWIKDRYLVTFLYNRWIKLQWAPVLISYFGLEYSIILMLVMAVFSIPQWLITERLINLK
jgi:uncharacterized membrane protein YraQ (UPF0718 family)